MPITITDISKFMAREGNEDVVDQVNNSAPLYASLKKQDTVGEAVIVNIDVAGQQSVISVADGGALSLPNSVRPEQGFALSKAKYGSMVFGRMAVAGLAGVADSIDLVNRKTEDMGKSMGRQIDRGLFGPRLAEGLGEAGGSATWTAVAGTPVTAQDIAAAAAGGTVAATYRFKNALSDFRIGEAYDMLVAGAGVTQTVQCAAITVVDSDSADYVFCNGVLGLVGTASVAPAAAVPVTPATDQFWQRGSLTVAGARSTNEIDGLQKICSPTDPLYTIPAGTRGWKGQTIAVNAALLPATLSGHFSRVRILSGDAPTHVVMSSAATTAYANGQISGITQYAGGALNSRRSIDTKFDIYGKGVDDGQNLFLMGRPFLVNDNCPDSEVFFINKDMLTIHEWFKPGVVKQSGDACLLNTDTLNYSFQFQAFLNLVTRKRAAHARLTGLTLV